MRVLADTPQTITKRVPDARLIEFAVAAIRQIRQKRSMPRHPGIPLTADFRQRLGAALDESNLSKENVAKQLDLSVSTLDGYLKRFDRNVPERKLVKLCTLLGISLPKKNATESKSSPDWRNLRSRTKIHETFSIDESQDAYEVAIKSKDGHAAHEIAYGLSDEYRFSGNYSMALAWLGHAESHVFQFSKYDIAIRTIREFKIQFKRILIRDFICSGNLNAALMAYDKLIECCRENCSIYPQHESDLTQIALNCRRQIAEINRIQGNYSNANLEFTELHQEYAFYYDSAAQKYCKLGALDCLRMLDSERFEKELANFAKIQQKAENLRLQTRLNRIKAQHIRWKATRDNDIKALLDLQSDSVLRDLASHADDHQNRIGKACIFIEQLSIILEMYGRGIASGKIPEFVFDKLSNLEGFCSGKLQMSLPMEAAHVNLLLAEAHLISGQNDSTMKYLVSAHKYYQHAELTTGLIRVACGMRILDKNHPITFKIACMEGIDKWYHKQYEKLPKSWKFSLTANLP